MTSPEPSFMGLEFKGKTEKCKIMFSDDPEPLTMSFPENASVQDFKTKLKKIVPEFVAGEISIHQIDSTGQLSRLVDFIDWGPNTRIYICKESSIDGKLIKLLKDLNCLKLAPTFCFSGIRSIERIKKMDEATPDFLNLPWVEGDSIWSNIKKRCDHEENKI